MSPHPRPLPLDFPSPHPVGEGVRRTDEVRLGSEEGVRKDGEGLTALDRPWLAANGHSLFVEKCSLVTDKTNLIRDLTLLMTDRPSLLMEIPLFVTDRTISITDRPSLATDLTNSVNKIPLSVMEKPFLVNNQCPSVTDKGLSVAEFGQLEAILTKRRDFLIPAFNHQPNLRQACPKITHNEKTLSEFRSGDGARGARTRLGDDGSREAAMEISRGQCPR